ncbi:NUMOD4 domain-containing protein [Lactococcus garvieae]|uniref:NUMOD4 domain-containing protein n=1 Tax=Lactococcus garvieae TaxID=1363 RepID=UPI002FE49872
MNEEWRDIVGYENIYQVSNLGRVRSLHYGRIRILAQAENIDGYLVVNLCVNMNKKSLRVHRLVASAFITNPQNKPQVNHIDENKKNNQIKNLEWTTEKENSNYGTRTKRAADSRRGMKYSLNHKSTAWKLEAMSR